MNNFVSAAIPASLPPDAYEGAMTFDAPTGLDQQVPGAAAGMKLGALLRRLWRGSPIIVLTAIGGLSLGYAALRYMPPKYTSSISILIDPKQPGSYGAEEAFTSLVVDNSKIENVQQIITSSQLLQKVVEAEGLSRDPNFAGNGDSLLRRASEYLRTGHVTPVPDTPDARVARAVDQLGKMIHTSRVGMTYVISIGVVAGDAKSAQHLANAVGNAYLADQVETKYAAAHNDAAWLQTRLQQLRNDLMASEARSESIRLKYGLTQTDGAPGSTIDRQTVTQLNEELARAQTEVAAAQARYAQAQHVLKGGGNPDTLSDVLGSKLISELRTQQAEASRHLADISVRYAPGHPLRKQAADNLTALNTQISLEIVRILGALRNDYETAVSRSNALRGQLDGIVARQAQIGNAEGRAALREADRIVEVNLTTYQATLNHLREVQQQETRQEAEARVISFPPLPTTPSSPKPAICLGAGMMAGLLAGLSIVMLLPGAKTKISDADLTRPSLRLPILSMLPLLNRRDLNNATGSFTIPDYLLRFPNSRYAENLRRLRLTLRNLLPPGARVVHLTSSLPGEGKSTLAASLALSSAVAGLRTVLVDLDLHNPSIAAMLGMDERSGAIEVLQGDITLDQVIVPFGDLPLSVITAGKGRPRPDLVEGPRLKAMIAELAAHADLVVLDTAPILAISDPLHIACSADVTMMVVAAGSARREQLELAVSTLRSAGAPLIGAVVNKTNLVKTDPYAQPAAAYYRRVADSRQSA